MRHHSNKRKFGREKGQRDAFLKGLAINLIRNGKIETTEARAKELRPYVEKLVTLAKEDTLARKRLILSKIYNQEIATNKLFKELAPKYKEVNGGYTRIVKLGQRFGDGASLAVIEFI